MRTPKRSPTVTTSPRPISVPLTNTSSSSLACRSSSITLDSPSASNSRSVSWVDPISTVSLTSTSWSSLKLAAIAPSAGIPPVMSFIGSLPPRSEEHTSELQSLMRISYAVFCLKKKKQHISTTSYNTATSSQQEQQK